MRVVDKEKCEGEEKENRADYFLSLVEEVLERGGTPNLRWSCFCFPLAKERRSDDGQIENSPEPRVVIVVAQNKVRFSCTLPSFERKVLELSRVA